MSHQLGWPINRDLMRQQIEKDKKHPWWAALIGSLIVTPLVLLSAAGVVAFIIALGLILNVI